LAFFGNRGGLGPVRLWGLIRSSPQSVPL
jgi:hypothetical protein